jgi:hypothetical protein
MALTNFTLSILAFRGQGSERGFGKPSGTKTAKSRAMNEFWEGNFGVIRKIAI